MDNIIWHNDNVTCNVLHCNNIASFKWFYTPNLEKVKPTVLANNTNIIAWLGFGIYICDVTCNNETLRYSHDFSFKEGVEYEQPKVQNQEEIIYMSTEWDLSKIPNERKEEIQKLVGNNEVKKLILIHNELSLSQNSYCCGSALNEVIANFKKWLDEKVS